MSQMESGTTLHDFDAILSSLQQNGSSTIGHTYSLHQAKGDVNAGNRKSGFLNKRSEGRLRNVWQRRKCEVREGFLNIYHADESKQPTKVNLLTCQMKPVADDRLCFDVVSYNRTYHFQASSAIRLPLLQFIPFPLWLKFNTRSCALFSSKETEKGKQFCEGGFADVRCSLKPFSAQGIRLRDQLA